MSSGAWKWRQQKTLSWLQRSKGSAECGRGGAAQDLASEASPPGCPHSPCSWLPPPAPGRNRLTLEVLDNVLNAEICEQGDDGQ